MAAPKSMGHYLGKLRWDRGSKYFVEYALWERGRAMPACGVVGFVCNQLKYDISDSHANQMLRALVEDGRVVKLARGLYVHVEHEAAARAEAARYVPAAPPPVDIFS